MLALPATGPLATPLRGRVCVCVCCGASGRVARRGEPRRRAGCAWWPHSLSMSVSPPTLRPTPPVPTTGKRVGVLCIVQARVYARAAHFQCGTQTAEPSATCQGGRQPLVLAHSRRVFVDASDAWQYTCKKTEPRRGRRERLHWRSCKRVVLGPLLSQSRVRVETLYTSLRRSAAT